MTFLNTLNLFNVGEIFVNFIAGLYTSVAKAYSLLMTFAAGGTSTSIANKISEFAKSAYTLVGIFMVFRLAISILTYLIDPEKMNDKQVGTSKLISRIVVSVVLLLSLNTFIFPTLRRIEDALLDDDSIIFNIFPNPFDTSKDENSYWKNMNVTIKNTIIFNNNFNLSNTIIPTVKAANSCSIADILHKDKLIMNGYYTKTNIKGNENAIDSYEIKKPYYMGGCMYEESTTEKVIQGITWIFYNSSDSFKKYPDQEGIAEIYNYNGSLSSSSIGSIPICTDNYTSSSEKFCIKFKVEKISKNVFNNEGEIATVTWKPTNFGFATVLDVNIRYVEKSNIDNSSKSKMMYYAEVSSDAKFTGNYLKLNFNSSSDGILTMNKWSETTQTGLTKDPIYVKSISGAEVRDGVLSTKINITNARFMDGYYNNGIEKLISDIENYPTNNCAVNIIANSGRGNNRTLKFYKENDTNSRDGSKYNYICGRSNLKDFNQCIKEYQDTYLFGTVVESDQDNLANEAEKNNCLDRKNKGENVTWDGENCIQDNTLINGLGFARSVLSSFTDRPDVITGEVEEGSGKFMESSAANDALGRMAEDKEIMFDWFLAIIAGIGVIVYMWILCIEVIVRNMKLILLQIIAPIPVICYMNPNDKILNSWFKQYMGTYLDLFVKLLAINAGFRFIPLVIDAVNPTNGFATFLIYCGGFLFIKAAPAFISKVFGLENMAGTFKDAAGIVKTGLMAGAGAVAGGVAGAVSGMGKGATFSTVAGGLFGGAARGLSSGAKGKILDGAKTQVGRNTKAKGAYLDGASWGQRMLSKVGMDTASRTDRGLKDLESDSKQYEAFKKHKENIDQTAEGSNFIKDLRSQRLADGSARYSESEIKAARKQFINHNSNTDNKGFVSSFEMTDNAGKKVIVSAGYEESKASAIQSELTKAESLRSGSSTINKVTNTPISDYTGLDKADTAVTNAKVSTDEAIYAAKNTDAYRVGDASRNNNSNGNK